ncbi:MAG: ureidoglycolate lyase, partial [Bacteroidetes bacterium]
MKLFRHGVSGKEKPGICLANGDHIDISAFGEDFDEAFFESDGLNRLSKWCEDHLKDCPKIESVNRFGQAIKRPSKIICIGLNYSDHAIETKATVPPEPVLFFKSTTALCGPNDPVVIPKTSQKTDWEVELAVVISKKASYVEERDSMEHVAGFVLHNDYSERAFQI